MVTQFSLNKKNDINKQRAIRVRKNAKPKGRTGH